MDDYLRLQLVDHMVGYLPFDASAGNLFEEHAAADDSPWAYETQALRHVLSTLATPDARLIILTGDAGHGKTHLCRRVIEATGLSAESALHFLTDHPKGDKALEHPTLFARPVRFVKDLSEGSEQDAAALLEQLMLDDASVALVCANEGRLRSVVSQARDRLGRVIAALEAGIHEGRTTRDGAVHVVNLNFQSVVPTEGGFLRYILEAWARDGRRWRACIRCAANDRCPILRNRLALGERSQAADGRFEGLIQLVRTAEQAGYVLTIRETLILTAYLLTGGLRCTDVAEKHRSPREARTLTDYHTERLLFERPLADTELRHLGVVKRMRRFDPGLVPHRDVDEPILRDIEEEAAAGQSWTSGMIGEPTLSQQRDESRKLLQEVRARRRESFFAGILIDEGSTQDRARRMGLFHYTPFAHVNSGDEDPRAMRQIIERVVLGLHVLQGIRPGDRSTLYLADPAFSRTGSHTSVVAVKIPVRELWLWGLHEYWRAIGGEAIPQLTSSVDWLDRQVVLCHRRITGEITRLISLDLLQFEFLLRAADGVVFAQFHAADRRRILSRLAHVAERSTESHEDIHFVLGDAIRKMVVERDGSIQVHGDS